MVALKWTDFPEAQAVPEGAGLPAGTLPCRPGVAPGQTIRPRQASPTGQTRPTGHTSSNGQTRPTVHTSSTGPTGHTRRHSTCTGSAHPAGRGLVPVAAPVLAPVLAPVAPPAPPPKTRRPTAAATRRRRTFFWRRVVAVVAIAGIGAAVWAAGGRLMAVAGAEPSHAAFERVYIAKPGDTIWGIAVRFSGNSDPRPLAYNLEAQIGGAVLQPGDQLTIPSAP